MEPHTGFIVAAFTITGLVLGGTIAAILLDYRVQLRQLARLSARLAARDASASGTPGRSGTQGRYDDA